MVLALPAQPRVQVAQRAAATAPFARYADTFWRLIDKGGRVRPFRLNACQRMVDARYEMQMDIRGYVRLLILKLRQGGITTYCTGRATHRSSTRSGTALTLAHEEGLPAIWLRRCRDWAQQLPDWVRPSIGATNRNELFYDRIPSRYYVGSAAGGFPGMGDCISFLHLSECGSWDKSPVCVDPGIVLQDLAPALPSGSNIKGTVQIYESTGKQVGDWWHRTWLAARAGETDFEPVFIPWFIAEDYRRDDLAAGVLDRSEYEREIVRYAQAEFGIDVDDAQLAWRRDSLRQPPYLGNTDEWSCRYPAHEHEAFLAVGRRVYTREMIVAARKTVNGESVARYTLLLKPGESPETSCRWEPTEAGEVVVWEQPNSRFHYVLGADCQWGKGMLADWDQAYVECLESGKVVASIRGRFSLHDWGCRLAAVGFRYNSAVIAPEINGKAGQSGEGVRGILLGLVAPWRYPNVFVRMKLGTMHPRPEDYGWFTDAHTKYGELVPFSQTGTLEGSFQWGDVGAVDEAETIVTSEDGSMGAPEGLHDDRWMARMITGYVAHLARPYTDLALSDPVSYSPVRTVEQRFREMAGEEEVADGSQDEET